MIPKVKYYGPRIPSTYAINLTAAASGSNGITVADDDDIDFGTGNFFIHWEGSLPDWTPAESNRVIHKVQSESNRVGFSVPASTGVLSVFARAGGVAVFTLNSTVATSITDGANAKLTVSVVREKASTAGSATFYVNGVQLGASVAIPAASPASISNSGSLSICAAGIAADGRLASNTISCIVGNFAPTASEVLDLCTNGIPASWKWGSQTGLLPATLNFTSGWSTTGTASITDADTISLPANNDSVRRSFSVTAGKKYLVRLVGSSTSIFRVSNFAQTENIIASVASGAFDISLYANLTSNGISFRNISGGATTIDFTTVQVYQVGATMALLPDTIPASSATAWSDTSGNTGGGTLPAAGATKVTIRR